MPKIIVLSAISGLGKSTYAQKLLAENPNTKIVSSDTIREKRFGDVNDQSHNREIFEEIIPLEIRIGIAWLRDVVVDATSVSVRDRKGYIELARKLNVPIECHYISLDLERAKKQNAARKERILPEFVLEKQANKWKEPTLEEGFDLVYKIEL